MISSLSRFHYLKNWVKILFTPGKKLQTTEIEEIQDLLNNQINKSFNILYNSFTVIKGCKLLLTNITNSTYEFILTEGQIYISSNQQGYFINTPSRNFSTNRTNIIYVGVYINKEILYEEEYNNPELGGPAFGSEGAKRLIIKPEIKIYETDNINTDPLLNAYPIALIKPKSLNFVNIYNDQSDGSPEIIYYKNEELSYLNQEINLSTYIKNLIELRLYEYAGDFISYGMSISINTKTNKLCITPGLAYINGKRIQTNYNIYFNIDTQSSFNNSLSLNKLYLFYITQNAHVKYIESEDLSKSLEVPNNSIAIAHVVINNRNNLLLDYSIIEAPTKMPSVLDIINFNKSNEENIKDLAQLALKADLLNLSSNSINNNLNGIFTDAFYDLNNSDIFFPNYKCSILPSIQAISLPFKSVNKNNRNITIDELNSNIIIESILNENNELVPYWSTIQGNDYKLFGTPRNITSAINLPTNSNNEILIKVSPSIIYKSDENTFINFSHPNLRKLSRNISTLSVDTPFNNNIFYKPIHIFATGFKSLQNNIKVKLNDISITSFNIIEGDVGSTTGTLKADANGSLSFTFNIPNINNSQVFSISLTSDISTNAINIDIIDPEISRIEKEKNGDSIQYNKQRYNIINSGLAQTFITNKSIMVKAIECTIMDFSSINNNNLLSVQIVSVDSNGYPTEVLGAGELSFLETAALSNTSPIPNRSTINLYKPINLERGKYAIVFNSAIDGIKLGGVKTGQPRLLDGSTFFYDPLKTEVLYYDTAWKISNSIDNLDCDLVLHKPVSLLSSTILDIKSNQDVPFNIIDIDLFVEDSLNSYIDLFILNDKNLYEQVYNGCFFFKDPILSTKLKINIRGTANTHPIINLDNLNINLITNEKSGVWISKNQEYESSYKNLTMAIDIFKPDNTTYKFYFSSNKGVTWEELSNPTIEIIDPSLNIFKYTFTENNLGFVSLNSEQSERYNLRYKVEFSVLNIENILPFFKNIVSITNP